MLRNFISANILEYNGIGLIIAANIFNYPSAKNEYSAKPIIMKGDKFFGDCKMAM